MALTDVKQLPGSWLRAFYQSSDTTPSGNNHDWYLTPDGGTTKHYPIRTEVVSQRHCVRFHFPGLVMGDYDLVGPGSLGSLTFSFRPISDYYWLNIRGLPSDDSAIYTPPISDGAGGTIDGRVVVGGEYFENTEALTVGGVLDLQQLKLSSDALKLRLVDLDGYLRALLSNEPKAVTAILGQDVGGGWIVEHDIADTYDHLWTEMGEAVKVSAKAADDHGRMVYTLLRGRFDSPQSLLRPGSRLFSNPVHHTLFVELWRYEPNADEATRLYVGMLDSAVPNPSGLTWTITTKDLLSSSTTLQSTTGTTDSRFVPWYWDIVKIDYPDAKSAWHISMLDEPRLLDVASMPKIFLNPLVFKGLSYELDRISPAVLMQFVGSEGLPGRLRISWDSDVRVTGYEVGGSWSSDIEWLDDDTFLVHNNMTANVDSDEEISFGLNLPDGDHTGAPKMLLPIPLKRAPDASASACPEELQDPWSNTIGYHRFTNSIDEDSAGYWSAFGFAFEPRYIVEIDDEQFWVEGVSRMPVFTAWNEDDGFIEDDFLQSDVLLTHPVPAYIATSEQEVSELLPFSQASYAYPGISGGLNNALSRFVEGGRSDTSYRPPHRGLGIPSDYCSWDRFPATNELTVSGWADGDKAPDDMLADYARSVGMAVGVRVDGVVSLAPCLHRPAQGSRQDVPHITIDNLLSPPTTQRIEPALAREIKASIGETTLSTRSLASTSRATIEWDLPSFAPIDQVGANSARLLELIGIPRQVLRIKIAENDVDQALAAGQWIRFSGTMPGNMYNLDDVDCYALIVKAKRKLFSRTLELEILLTPEVEALDYGFHWGSAIVGYDSTNSLLYLPVDAGVDFGDDMPPGFGSDDLVCRLFDGQQWCDDYFTLTPDDSRDTIHSTDCYVMSVDSYTVPAGTPHRGLHTVLVNGGLPGSLYIKIDGDYRSQFRIGDTIYSDSTIVAAQAGTISDVEYISGSGETQITADWTTAPSSITPNLVWSSSLALCVDSYTGTSLGDDEKAHHFFADPSNDAVDTWYAPGAKIWEINSLVFGTGDITIVGDIRPDFPNASVAHPFELEFSPPRNPTAGGRVQVTGSSYSSVSGLTTLTLANNTGAGITSGDWCRDARMGKSYRYTRSATVGNNDIPFNFQ